MSGFELGRWLFRVQPGVDESFSHFLGRFRRANHLSHQTLAQVMCELEGKSHGVGEVGLNASIIEAWEMPSRRCQPSASQLEILAQLSQLEVTQLSELLPGAAITFATRLCSQCYRDEPIHRLSWQVGDCGVCSEHHCRLLSECPGCKTALRLPSLWAVGRCEYCWLGFEQMGDYEGIDCE